MSQFYCPQSWAQSRRWGLRKKLRAPRVDPGMGWVVSVGSGYGGRLYLWHIWRSGARRGLAAGEAPRRWCSVPPPPSSKFLQYNEPSSGGG